MPPITGRVVKWVEEKGHGILTRDDGGENVLVKRSGCGGGSLVVGGKVTYSVRKDPASGQLSAFEVEGEAVCERGEQADAKIALRTATTPQPGKTYQGVVVAWNDLIGSGIIRTKNFSAKAERKGLSEGHSLVIGKDVTFEISDTPAVSGDIKTLACNVRGEAVVAEGELPDSQLPRLEGVKKGTVLQWSSTSGEGLISWDGGEDIFAKSDSFNLQVGTLVEYEIKQENGRLCASNMKGVGVVPKVQRAVSSRLRSMKFMKRHDELEEHQAMVEAMKAAKPVAMEGSADTEHEV
eukprot:TRINITY_DN910_c1_g1_i1.p1 TRINITY_DN910_c1_g1~~TRINITY_DN910_c1_g1_i1.p1  ORF type:complete len:294 (+),score=109.33 TRINITY_DN910_c1_g1_i1:87-968(+)